MFNPTKSHETLKLEFPWGWKLMRNSDPSRSHKEGRSRLGFSLRNQGTSFLTLLKKKFIGFQHGLVVDCDSWSGVLAI